MLVLTSCVTMTKIRDHGELNLPDAKGVKDKELKMTMELIDKSTSKFKPEEYEDTYIEDLKKVIKYKAKGRKPRAK